MVVDEFGKEFLRLCDGSRKVNEIVELLGDKSEFADIQQEEVMEFVSSLVNAGFLRTSPMSLEKIERNSALVQVYLHLTHGCNLRCKHCHVSAGTPYEREMSDKRILALIDEISEMEPEELIITGGEPFLRKKLLYNVVEKAKNNGIQKVGVETNGTLITDEDASFFKKYSVKVGVSLDGTNPKSNDFIRGKGAFNKAITGIKHLIRKDVYVNIAMALMRPNLSEAETMVKFAAKLGAKQVTLNTVVMKGRARHYPQLNVPLSEVGAVVKKAWKTAREVGIRTNVDEFLSQLKGGMKKYSCGAGVNILSIDANGDVYPCNFFVGGPLKAGNVYDRSLKKVLEESPLIKEFRNLSVLDTECRDCELRFICAGCPAESFEVYGDLKKRTPWCSLRKEITWSVINKLAHELWEKMQNNPTSI